MGVRQQNDDFNWINPLVNVNKKLLNMAIEIVSFLP